jgi:hypothetical protein
VPCEPKGPAGKDVVAEQPREVGPLKQANEDVTLAEIGVSEGDASEESGRDGESEIHRPAIL